jgi:putative transcriptional regulator
MKQLLRSINLVTKFQIMVEVAANQPDIQQRDIARRLDLSPQAVSDYVKELLKDGWLVSTGRSKYRVTREGVDWMLKGLKDWQGYSDVVQKAIAGLSVTAAVADCDIDEGQRVGLVMREGLLFATESLNTEAIGIAASSAAKGEDVGVSNIDGIVRLDPGKVTVLRVPSVQGGGSRQASLNRLRNVIKGKSVIGVIGLEALIAVGRLGLEPTCVYAVGEALVEAAQKGLSPAVVCVDGGTADLLATLEEHGIDYEILDARKA